MDNIEIVFLVPLLGFGLGGLLGGTVQRSQFCTMGAVSDIYLIGNWNRLRS